MSADWKRTERDLKAGIYILVSESGQLWELNYDRQHLNRYIRERDDLGKEWKVKKMVLAPRNTGKQK